MMKNKDTFFVWGRHSSSLCKLLVFYIPSVYTDPLMTQNDGRIEVNITSKLLTYTGKAFFHEDNNKQCNSASCLAHANIFF